MSPRHNVTRFGAAVLALGLGTPGFAAAADSVALATVARELGFTYTYLPYENAVSLARPGATIIVRPGDAFFFTNERREPVYGDVPSYHDNDVYVSRAFVDEIRNVGTRPSANVDAAGRGDSPVIAPRPVAAGEPPGSVATAVATYDASTDRALITGTATPGSIVGIVLKAELSDALPVVVLDRTYVIAGADGTFAARLSFGAAHWPPGRYVAQAYGARNVRAISSVLPANLSRSASPHTAADDVRIR